MRDSISFNISLIYSNQRSRGRYFISYLIQFFIILVFFFLDLNLNFVDAPNFMLTSLFYSKSYNLDSDWVLIWSDSNDFIWHRFEFRWSFMVTAMGKLSLKSKLAQLFYKSLWDTNGGGDSLLSFRYDLSMFSIVYDWLKKSLLVKFPILWDLSCKTGGLTHPVEVTLLRSICSERNYSLSRNFKSIWNNLWLTWKSISFTNFFMQTGQLYKAHDLVRISIKFTFLS